MVKNRQRLEWLELGPAGSHDAPQLERIELVSNTPGWSHKQFQEEMRLSYSQTFGARASGVLVGFIVLQTIYETGHIINFAVDTTWRRKGVGRELLEAAIACSESSGCSVVTLEVRESNSIAQALYSSFGFEVLGYRPRYYADNGEDALIMSLQCGSETSGSEAVTC